MSALPAPNWDYKSNADYHLRQYKEPYRSTVSLIDYLKRTLDTSSVKRVLDMGCGGGANIHWLKQSFPDWEFTGLDFDEGALAVAREQNAHATFYQEDIMNMTEVVKEEPFDLVLCLQVVLASPFNLYEFIDLAAPLAKQDIVLTSLFSEEWFEQEAIRRDLKNDKEYLYRIDSLKRLEDHVKDKNLELSYEEIVIDTDLPKPEPLTLSTYTAKLENGERLQISPYILMPWYTVRLKKTG